MEGESPGTPHGPSARLRSKVGRNNAKARPLCRRASRASPATPSGQTVKTAQRDVRWVQRRLLELTYLTQADFDAEYPPANITGVVSSDTLKKTIEAIEAFEREVLEDPAPQGRIEVSGRKKNVEELKKNRIPRPSPKDYDAVVAARAELQGGCHYGLFISAPVGDLTRLIKSASPGKDKGDQGCIFGHPAPNQIVNGNLKVDVLAVRTKLELLGKLSPLKDELNVDAEGKVPITQIEDICTTLSSLKRDVTY